MNDGTKDVQLHTDNAATPKNYTCIAVGNDNCKTSGTTNKAAKGTGDGSNARKDANDATCTTVSGDNCRDSNNIVAANKTKPN